MTKLIENVSEGSMTLATLAIVTTLTVGGFVYSATGTAQPTRLYQDEDGTATKESEAASSSTVVPLMGAVQFASAFGALIDFFFGKARRAGEWHRVGYWMLICAQSDFIKKQRRANRRYMQGIYGAASVAVVLASVVYDASYVPNQNRWLSWCEVCAALVAFLAFTSLPRRPIVFFKGERIDQEHGASILSRLSFTWSPLHGALTCVSGTISLSDLPSVAHKLRVRTLKDRFRAIAKGRKLSLWRQLLWTFLPRLGQQWILVLLKALSEFVAQYALHQLLKCIESRSTQSAEVWLWVWCIGGALLAEHLVGNVLNWINQMKLTMPVIALANGLVFEKMTRRQLGGGPRQATGAKGKSRDQAGPSLAVMMSQDSSTIAQACGHSHHFPMALFKLLFDVAYLSQLIGIKSILVGGATSLVLVPLSTRLANRHRAMERELTKSHDCLSNLTSEALQGLRQIRLSSMEQVWQGRIFDARRSELERIWDSGVALVLLTLVANLGPILLASVALSVYSLDSGNLSPSVAFASLGLFSSLHNVFRDLPLKAAGLHDSWISCQRVQHYLDEPEQNPTSLPSNQIFLEEATVAWPGGDGSGSASTAPDFQLSTVSLHFPKGKLSIVTGKTGSGKSLLLASILDEAKLQSGRFGKPASATAFVSQPPWVENCTLKDNILFGYPLEEERYRKVIHACALDHDLDVLPDRDLTKAGVNGAALSGGQRWRVALARALYSPAEILVMEDILSAVDAPVGLWIADNGLTGELAEGRTRILVTHNPDICMGAANYHVVVQDGTATGTRRSPSAKNVVVLPPTATADKKEKASNADDPKSGQKEQKAPPALSHVGQRHAAGRSNQEIFTSYLWAAGGVKTCVLIVLISVSLIITEIGLVASGHLFRQMIESVLTAPLKWVDSTPIGKVLQSLGTDMYLVDHRTSMEMNGLVGSLSRLVLICFTSFVSAPNTLLASMFLCLFYLKIASQHFRLSQNLKKLVPAAHRPLLEHANSTAMGLATIRAFGRTELYKDRMHDLIDSGTKVGWHMALGLKWLNIRVGFLGAVFVTVSAAALVYDEADAAAAGLTISLAMQLKTALGGLLTSVTVLEMGSHAIGRVLDLAEMPTETKEGNEVPEDSSSSSPWPANGNIEVRDLTMSYDPALPPALKAITFSVKPRQRLGVVGRTGAGKSSLANALLRFTDITGGNILIDGLDISTLTLRALRSAVNMIPQDPFLFSGTLRSNLDIRGEKTDQELRSVLRRVHLLSSDYGDDAAAAGGDEKRGHGQFVDLDMAIPPGGAGALLSHGQRQLVCLARAMLTRCRILILDEATSSMDRATDATVQDVIRREFSEATILVIAHKLLTVADFDSILVLSNGEVAEFGAPAKLMGRKGVFHNMVEQSGDRDRIKSAIGH